MRGESSHIVPLAVFSVAVLVGSFYVWWVLFEARVPGEVSFYTSVYCVPIIGIAGEWTWYGLLRKNIGRLVWAAFLNTILWTSLAVLSFYFHYIIWAVI